MKHEWIYFWGRLSTGEFFHFARFNNESKRYSHLSLNGKFYEGDWVAGKHFFKTPHLQVGAEPISSHIPHFTQSSYYYYSIPFLEGVAQIKGKSLKVSLWFDFESNSEQTLSDWEWISLKLGEKIGVIIYKRERNSFAKFIIEDKSILSPFIVEGEQVTLTNLGLTYDLNPFNPEIIFHPTNGRPYSEQPFEVIFKGKKIGYGMRERTYHRGTNVNL